MKVTTIILAFLLADSLCSFAQRDGEFKREVESNTYIRARYDFNLGTKTAPGIGACSVHVNEDTVAMLAGGSPKAYEFALSMQGSGLFHWAEPSVCLRNMKSKQSFYVDVPQEVAVTAASCHALPFSTKSNKKYAEVLVFGGAQGYFTYESSLLELFPFNVTDNLVIYDLNKDKDNVRIVEKRGKWPSPRAFHAWVQGPSQKKLYMFGGSGFHEHEDDMYGDVFDDLWELDTVSLRWNLLSRRRENLVTGVDWPSPRRGHVMNIIPATKHDKRKILMFGGCKTVALSNSLRDGCWSVDGVNATMNDLWEYLPMPNKWIRIPENDTAEYFHGIYIDGGWPSPRAFMSSYSFTGSLKKGQSNGLMGIIGGNVASWREGEEHDQIDYDVPEDQTWFEFDYPRKKWVMRPQKAVELDKDVTSVVLDAHRFSTTVVHNEGLYHFNSLRYVEPDQITARETSGMLSLTRYFVFTPEEGSFKGGNAIFVGTPGASDVPISLNSFGMMSDNRLVIYGGTQRYADWQDQNQVVWGPLSGVWRMFTRHDSSYENDVANQPRSWEYAPLHNSPIEMIDSLSSYGPNGIVVATKEGESLPSIYQFSDKTLVVRVIYEKISYGSGTECYAPEEGYEEEGMIQLGGSSPTVMWSGYDSDPIFMFGGTPVCYSGRNSNQLLKFDIIEGRWENITTKAIAATPTDMYPPPLYNARGASCADGNIMYIIGGTKDDGTFSGDLFSLTSEKNEYNKYAFRRISPVAATPYDTVPPALDSPSWTPIRYKEETAGSRIVLFGGGEDGVTMNTMLYMFDIFTETWRSIKLAGSPRARKGHAAVWDEDSELLYVFGGVATESVDGRAVTQVSSMEIASIRPSSRDNEMSRIETMCLKNKYHTRYCAESMIFKDCDMTSFASGSGNRECSPCPEGTERAVASDLRCHRVNSLWCNAGWGYVDEYGAARCVCNLGYNGMRCDNPVWAYVLAGLLGGLMLLMAVILGGIFIYRRMTRKTLARLNAYKQLHEESSTSKSSTEKWDLKADDIRIVGRVGSGASAIVYRGQWHGNDVAVKEFVDITINNDLLEREMDMLTSLSHPNIIRFWGCSLNRCYLVMEYCSLGTLDDMIHSSRVIKAAGEYDVRARKAIVEIARGMHYLHSLNPPVLHRDLKPENVLVDSNWVVKIADFGLSKRMCPEEKYMTRGAGTPSYCAPEVWERALDENNPSSTTNFTTKADVFSFGIMLHEIVFRERPFDTCTFAVEVTQRIARGERPQTSLENMVRKRNLFKLMERCWHQDVTQRPEFGEILAILDCNDTWS